METKEQLAGYFLINARDLNEATRIATQVPGARIGTVEVRPLIEITGLPMSNVSGKTQPRERRSKQ